MYQNNFLGSTGTPGSYGTGGYTYPSATSGNYLPKEQQTTTPVYPSQTSPTQMIKVRPVFSFEEAKATPIEFDGSLNIFTDIGNKKIYTKQLNLDGTATLNVYALVEEKSIEKEANKEEEKRPVEYISREEFNQAFSQLQAQLARLGERRKSTSLNNF